MIIKLDQNLLEQIYDSAKNSYLDRHNQAVPSHLYHIDCILSALAEVATREGQTLTIVTPSNKGWESVED